MKRIPERHQVLASELVRKFSKLTDLEHLSAEAALARIKIPIHRRDMLHAASFRLPCSFFSSAQVIERLWVLNNKLQRAE